MRYAIGLGVVALLGLGSMSAEPGTATLVTIAVDKDNYGSTGSSSTSGIRISDFRIFRAWSDGSVDATWFRFDNNFGQEKCDLIEACGPIMVVPPTPCAADISHNGEVDVTDLLEVLGTWGPCN